MSSFRRFAAVYEAVRRAEQDALKEVTADVHKWSQAGIDAAKAAQAGGEKGNRLYQPFDPRQRVDYSPLLAKDFPTIQNAWNTISAVCSQNAAQCNMTQMIDGEKGFLFDIILRGGIELRNAQNGGYEGQSNIARIETAIRQALLVRYPTVVVDLINQQGISLEPGPAAHRGMATFRCRLHPWAG